MFHIHSPASFTRSPPITSRMYQTTYPIQKFSILHQHERVLCQKMGKASIIHFGYDWIHSKSVKTEKIEFSKNSAPKKLTLPKKK